MIHITFENDTSLAFEPSGSLSPVKPGPLSIDLSELFSSKTTLTPSCLSGYDSASVKTDEDIMKPLAIERFSTQATDLDAFLEICQPEQKVTLGDIISKRSYTRRPKDIKMNDSNEEKPKRRRRKANAAEDIEETITKKEKLENGMDKRIAVSMEDVSPVPAIVIKDGKVQMVMPAGESINKQLEIVQPSKKKVTTSTSFKQINHTEKWSEKETQKFYRALELFGTDFSMIAKVFKNRNRNQIKNKFLREEKLAPEKVNKTFKERKTTTFQNVFKKFEKLKKIQANIQAQPLEERAENIINPGFPLLQSIQIFPASTDNIKLEESAVVFRDRSSGSFHSTTSIDSTDRSIMEDLSDIFFPQKSLFSS